MVPGQMDCESRWDVYIVECSDGTYYTGISVDVDRRVDERHDDVGRPCGRIPTFPRMDTVQIPLPRQESIIGLDRCRSQSRVGPPGQKTGGQKGAKERITTKSRKHGCYKQDIRPVIACR